MSVYTRRRGRPTLGQVQAGYAGTSAFRRPAPLLRWGEDKLLATVDGGWIRVGPFPPVGTRYHVFARRVKVWLMLARAKALKAYIRGKRGGLTRGIRKDRVVLVSPTARVDARIERLEHVLNSML